ncbi:MAG: hypothetical protein ACK4RK_12185 [Gemmataceae bacterium]
MWQIGDRVLARWPAEVAWWYPGIVCGTSDDFAVIQFDDGDRAQVANEEISEIDISVGSRVFGRWLGGPFYYPGLVTSRRGEAIYIRYDDGDEEWTAIAMVRVERQAD